MADATRSASSESLIRRCSAIARGRSARRLVTASSRAALSTRMRRIGAGRVGRRAGPLVWISAAGELLTSVGDAIGGAVPGPVDAHPAMTIASRPKSSALPRQTAGNMALLWETFGQYRPCQKEPQVLEIGWRRGN